MNPYQKEIDLIKKNKWDILIEQYSEKYNIPIGVIFGLGSRESAWGLTLDADMCGDRGYGHGIFQLDSRWHREYIAQNTWKDTESNMNYAIHLLRDYVNYFKHRYDDTTALHYAISGYNCGCGNTDKAISQGIDYDFYTTGKDYSKDVLKRASYYLL